MSSKQQRKVAASNAKTLRQVEATAREQDLEYIPPPTLHYKQNYGEPHVSKTGHQQTHPNWEADDSTLNDENENINRERKEVAMGGRLDPTSSSSIGAHGKSFGDDDISTSNESNPVRIQGYEEIGSALRAELSPQFQYYCYPEPDQQEQQCRVEQQQQQQQLQLQQQHHYQQQHRQHQQYQHQCHLTCLHEQTHMYGLADEYVKWPTQCTPSAALQPSSSSSSTCSITSSSNVFVGFPLPMPTEFFLYAPTSSSSGATATSSSASSLSSLASSGSTHSTAGSQVSTGRSSLGSGEIHPLSASAIASGPGPKQPAAMTGEHPGGPQHQHHYRQQHQQQVCQGCGAVEGDVAPFEAYGHGPDHSGLGTRVEAPQQPSTWQGKLKNMIFGASDNNQVASASSPEQSGLRRESQRPVHKDYSSFRGVGSGSGEDVETGAGRSYQDWAKQRDDRVARAGSSTSTNIGGVSGHGSNGSASSPLLDADNRHDSHAHKDAWDAMVCAENLRSARRREQRNVLIGFIIVVCIVGVITLTLILLNRPHAGHPSKQATSGQPPAATHDVAIDSTSPATGAPAQTPALNVVLHGPQTRLAQLQPVVAPHGPVLLATPAPSMAGPVAVPVYMSGTERREQHARNEAFADAFRPAAVSKVLHETAPGDDAARRQAKNLLHSNAWGFRAEGEELAAEGASARATADNLKEVGKIARDNARELRKYGKHYDKRAEKANDELKKLKKHERKERKSAEGHERRAKKLNRKSRRQHKRARRLRDKAKRMQKKGHKKRARRLRRRARRLEKKAERSRKRSKRQDRKYEKEHKHAKSMEKKHRKEKRKLRHERDKNHDRAKLDKDAARDLKDAAKHNRREARHLKHLSKDVHKESVHAKDAARHLGAVPPQHIAVNEEPALHAEKEQKQQKQQKEHKGHKDHKDHKETAPLWASFVTPWTGTPGGSGIPGFSQTGAPASAQGTNSPAAASTLPTATTASSDSPAAPSSTSTASAQPHGISAASDRAIEYPNTILAFPKPEHDQAWLTNKEKRREKKQRRKEGKGGSEDEDGDAGDDDDDEADELHRPNPSSPHSPFPPAGTESPAQAAHRTAANGQGPAAQPGGHSATATGPAGGYAQYAMSYVPAGVQISPEAYKPK